MSWHSPRLRQTLHMNVIRNLFRFLCFLADLTGCQAGTAIGIDLCFKRLNIFLIYFSQLAADAAPAAALALLCSAWR